MEAELGSTSLSLTKSASVSGPPARERVSGETIIGIGASALAVLAMAVDHLLEDGGGFAADPAAFGIGVGLSLALAAVVFGRVVSRARAVGPESAAKRAIVCRPAGGRRACNAALAWPSDRPRRGGHGTRPHWTPRRTQAPCARRDRCRRDRRGARHLGVRLAGSRQAHVVRQSRTAVMRRTLPLARALLDSRSDRPRRAGLESCPAESQNRRDTCLAAKRSNRPLPGWV